MKYLSLLFCLCFLFIGFGCNHTPKSNALTGNLSSDLQLLLTDGDYEVQVMDSIIQSKREIELSFRMQQAVQKNEVWYSDYVSNYPTSPVLPYHVNFGLTEQEYNELMQMKLNINLLPSLTTKIKVKNSKGLIQFNSDGKIPYLEDIIVNTNDNIVFSAQYPLHFSDTIFVANENHGLKSQWKGYKFSYSEPAENDTISQMLNTKHYYITIAQLLKTGNTLISINKREEMDGELKLKLDKPLVFKKL